MYAFELGEYVEYQCERTVCQVCAIVIRSDWGRVLILY